VPEFAFQLPVGNVRRLLIGDLALLSG